VTVHAEGAERRRERGVECRPAWKRQKSRFKKIMEVLPDNASLEDIQYHIYARQKVEQGLPTWKPDA